MNLSYLIKQKLSFGNSCICVFEQWKALKTYANQNEINNIGDIPILLRTTVPMHVASEVFQFDENRNPTFVAGFHRLF